MTRTGRAAIEHRGLFQRSQAIIDSAVEFADLEFAFHQGNRRQKPFALQSATVEFVRRLVRCRHQRHAIGEQRFRQWASEHRVLCLDEFHVADITDAMLLANLLEALLDDGVTVVATSNEAPDELYGGGLQRERFLPAIALMKRELEVCELAGAVDYRLRALEQAPVFYCCATGAAHEALARSFRAVSGGAPTSNAALVVEGRPIPTAVAPSRRAGAT